MVTKRGNKKDLEGKLEYTLEDFINALPGLIAETAFSLFTGSEEEGIKKLEYEDPRNATKYIPYISLELIRDYLLNKIGKISEKLSNPFYRYSEEEKRKEIEEMESYSKILKFIDENFEEISSIYNELLRKVKGQAEAYIDFFYIKHYTPQQLFYSKGQKYYFERFKF